MPGSRAVWFILATSTLCDGRASHSRPGRPAAGVTMPATPEQPPPKPMELPRVRSPQPRHSVARVEPIRARADGDDHSGRIQAAACLSAYEPVPGVGDAVGRPGVGDAVEGAAAIAVPPPMIVRTATAARLWPVPGSVGGKGSGPRSGTVAWNPASFPPVWGGIFSAAVPGTAFLCTLRIRPRVPKKETRRSPFIRRRVRSRFFAATGKGAWPGLPPCRRDRWAQVRAAPAVVPVR